MDSGLQVSTDRDASLPERHVPPKQHFNDQYRQPMEDPGHIADKSHGELPKHDREKLSRDAQKHRLPFGWTPAFFALAVGAITAIVVGAAVGGGVGSLVSSKRCAAFYILLLIRTVNQKRRKYTFLYWHAGHSFQ